jgi:hypothetical protein
VIVLLAEQQETNHPDKKPEAKAVHRIAAKQQPYPVTPEDGQLGRNM